MSYTIQNASFYYQKVAGGSGLTAIGASNPQYQQIRIYNLSAAVAGANVNGIDIELPPGEFVMPDVGGGLYTVASLSPDAAGDLLFYGYN